jgi:SpoVK/Ycf46/Vps4 family AAA+-type ATPase
MTLGLDTSSNGRPSANTPYTHPGEHLANELQRLDVLVEAGFHSMKAVAYDPAMDSFRGLVVTDAEAEQLLSEDPGFAVLSDEQQQHLQSWDRYIASRLAVTQQQGFTLPLLHLQRSFRLDELDVRLLITALAPEINRKYEKLYAYLQDDMTCRFATVDLLLRLCCRSDAERREAALRLAPASKLSRDFFRKELSVEAAQRSLLARPIRVDERIVSYVQDQEWRQQGALSGLKKWLSGVDRPHLLTDLEVQERLRPHLARHGVQGGLVVYFVHGLPGSGKTLHARYAAASVGKPLLEWNLLSSPAEEPQFKEAVERVLREAKLLDAIPAFDRLHELAGLPEEPDRRGDWLAESLSAWEGAVFLLSERAWLPDRSIPGVQWIEIALKLPDPGTRQRIWKTVAGESFRLGEAEAGVLAAKFRFTPGRIAASVAAAVSLAEWEQPTREASGPLDPHLLHRAGYAQIKHRLSETAVKLEPSYTWEDLILPDEPKALLRQACNRLLYRHVVFGEWGFERKFAYGKGISMLFTGPPGTGKTMSAMVMAKEMEAEVYRIDLSRVVSKYIGETEKNLHDIFEEGQRSGVILFFDEADALFGKRSEVKDAHDKYANMETSYLLQKMEEYDGLTILASNFAQNLDDAFMRRIQFIVRYPFPDPAQREQLWRSAFPREQPAAAGIDFSYLANNFDLAGGSIKNAVLTAAYLAAGEGTSIGMKHVVEAIKQEYKKTGKVLLKDRLGVYA